MKYEETADLNTLLQFVLDNVVTTDDELKRIQTLKSSSEKSGWTEKLLRDFRQYIESIVPEGDYCYSYVKKEEEDNTPWPKTQPCPFWDSDPNQEEQESGYCHLIQFGDWQLNDLKIYVCQRTGKKQTANEIGIHLALLWDQVKECDVNPDRRIDN